MYIRFRQKEEIQRRRKNKNRTQEEKWQIHVWMRMVNHFRLFIFQFVIFCLWRNGSSIASEFKWACVCVFVWRPPPTPCGCCELLWWNSTYNVQQILFTFIVSRLQLLVGINFFAIPLRLNLKRLLLLLHSSAVCFFVCVSCRYHSFIWYSFQCICVCVCVCRWVTLETTALELNPQKHTHTHTTLSIQTCHKYYVSSSVIFIIFYNQLRFRTDMPYILSHYFQESFQITIDCCIFTIQFGPVRRLFQRKFNAVLINVVMHIYTYIVMDENVTNKITMS